VQNEEFKKEKQKEISWGSVGIVSVVVLLLVYSTDINPAKANKATLIAIRAVSANNVSTISAYKHAEAIPTPHIDDVRNDFARTAQQTILQLYEQKKNDEANKLVELVRTELKKNIELHPMDIRVHIQLAQLDTMVAQQNQDINLLIEAEQLLDQALVLSPKRQQLQYMLSGIKLQLKKNNEAVAMLQSTIDNNSTISEGWWRLAFAYQSIGESQKAIETIAEAEARGVKFDSQGENIVSSILSNATQNN
jgi:predicted Zn-dependent protease